MDKQKAKIVIDALQKQYPNAQTALQYNSVYQLLVAVMLSAQCTDERVNKVTKILFERCPTPSDMLTLSFEELASIIKPCGLFNSKAKHILQASKDIIEKHNGQVPKTLSELTMLSGVGRKTADVMIAVAFNGDAIPVDTHVFRVANRVGLANAKTPSKTEFQLMKVIEKSSWSKAHHYILWHGRLVCKARKPMCENCTISEFCKYYKKVKK